MLARVTNSMKRTLVVSMVALMAVGYVACSEDSGTDSSSPVFKDVLSNGKVEVNSIGVASDSDGFVFDLDVYFDEADQLSGVTASKERLLEVRVFDQTGNSAGYTATLTDKSNNLLWEFECRIDTEDPNYYRMAERTATDELIIEAWVGNNNLTEIYTQNGIADTFNLPTSDIGLIREVHQSLLTGAEQRGK